jgi:2-iminobutanoate/2-iminopropanoate deaminase
MKKVIRTEGAPATIGPYSQAISARDLVLCSGQLGLDPVTGRLVGEGAAEQAAQGLRNLQAVLAAAGLSLRDIVKTTIFLTDMRDFKEVNDIYSSFFPDEPPARSTVGVAALPLSAKVEIEAIALRS